MLHLPALGGTGCVSHSDNRAERPARVSHSGRQW